MADKVLFRDQTGDTDEELSETNISQVLALTNISAYVDRGLGFTLDSVNDELDIGSGHAVLEDSNQAYHVLPDARTNLGLTGSTTNYVYLQADTSDGTVSYHIDTDDSPPTGSNIISLKVGEVDTTADTTTEVNRNPSDETGNFTSASIDNTDSPYTTQGEGIIFVDTSSAAVTVELASADAEAGKQTIIIDDADNAATNNITISTEGSETIDPDADSTKVIAVDGAAGAFRSNGTNWDSDRALDLDEMQADVGAITTLSDVDDLSGGITGSTSLTNLLGSGLSLVSNALRIDSSIWDGTDLVADVNNTNTTATNLNSADASAASEGDFLQKGASGTDLAFGPIDGWWEETSWGWSAESIFSTTTGSGSVSFLTDTIQLREPGNGAAAEASRIYNPNVEIDPSVSGSVELSVSNVTFDNSANARFDMGITDTPDATGIDAGDDVISMDIFGDGTIRARVEDGGTATTNSDTSQNNTFVNNIESIKISWDGSTNTVEVSDGNTTVTVTASTNYPSGENLFFKAQVEDSNASAAENADMDIDSFTLT